MQGNEKERESDQHMWMSIHPFKKASSAFPRCFFSRAQPFFVVRAPVCCWFYFLKKLCDAARTGFRLFLEKESVVVVSFSLSRFNSTIIVRDEREKVFQLFFFVQFFLPWKKLKMHKTGIEWEKVEDPFNRCSQGEILLISNRFFFFCCCYLVKCPKLQFSRFEWKRGGIQGWEFMYLWSSSSSLAKAIPFADDHTMKNSIKHLIYHLHGIKKFFWMKKKRLMTWKDEDDANNELFHGFFCAFHRLSIWFLNSQGDDERRFTGCNLTEWVVEQKMKTLFC